MDKVKFLNITINNISLSSLLQKLTEKGGFIVTPNVDHLVNLQNDSDFLKAYHIADYVICDSKILQYTLKLLGQPIQEKISGSDLLPAFYNYNKNNENIKIFLLGSMEGVAHQAKIAINMKVGREIVIDALSPSFGFESNVDECFAIIDKINQSGANVLAIGVSSPKQEKWIVKYRSFLPNIKVFLPIGATIDFEAGYKPRSPQWMSNVGLEWFYRLITEPKRLWKRYLIDSFPFFIYVIQYYFNLYRHNPILELKSMPLGKILYRAGLLSEEQIKLILHTQKENNYQIKFGKITENLGFLSSETITFFAEELPKIIESNELLSVNDYLRKANLISSQDFNLLPEKITKYSSTPPVKELIVKDGYLSQKTLDWFIQLQQILKSR